MKSQRRRAESQEIDHHQPVGSDAVVVGEQTANVAKKRL